MAQNVPDSRIDSAGALEMEIYFCTTLAGAALVRACLACKDLTPDEMNGEFVSMVGASLKDLPERYVPIVWAIEQSPPSIPEAFALLSRFNETTLRALDPLVEAILSSNGSPSPKAVEAKATWQKLRAGVSEVSPVQDHAILETTSRQKKLAAYFALGAAHFESWHETGKVCELAYITGGEQSALVLKKHREELVAQLVSLAKSSIVHHWDIGNIFREAMGDFAFSDFVEGLMAEFENILVPHVTDEELLQYENEVLFPEQWDFSGFEEFRQKA